MLDQSVLPCCELSLLALPRCTCCQTAAWAPFMPPLLVVLLLFQLGPSGWLQPFTPSLQTFTSATGKPTQPSPLNM